MSDTTPLSNVIEVRPDERFDEALLAEYLRERLPGSDQPLRVEQFGGGHANLTFLLRYGEGDGEVDYVLRRPPLGTLAKGAHDMKREYTALSKLWQGFSPAPRAHLFCDDSSVLGADFFVMEKRGGVVVRREVPEEFGGGKDPVANAKLSRVVIDTLVDFHAVEPEAIGLGELGKPDGFLERQVKGWLDRFERAKTHDFPLADELGRWLIDNMPAPGASGLLHNTSSLLHNTSSLLHNDWKLDNMAVAANDPGRCVAVYDWDMCTLGDPLCDLGTLLCSWIDRGEGAIGPGAMPTQTEGFMKRAEAVARYGERSGRDVSVMPYYHSFGTFKMAVVLQQLFVRYHRGESQDERFAGMDRAAEALFEQADRWRA